MSARCLDQAMKVLNGEPTTQFVNVTAQLPGAGAFTQDDIDKIYQPTLSDDFVPPPTAPVDFYKKAGL
jgi:hypothetical protein